MATAAVLGGAGGIGNVVSRVLADMNAFDTVLIADIDERRIDSMIRSIGSDKISGRKLDFRVSDDIDRVLTKADVAVNCSWDDFNHIVTDAAVRTSTDMVDLSSSMSGSELLQIGRTQEAIDAGITIILELGVDPGISNVFARKLTEDMESVNSIRIRDADRDIGTVEHPFRFTVRGVLEEWTWDAVTWDRGKFKLEPPLSRWEDTVFPEPINTLRTYLTPHEEPITLPKFLGKPVDHVDFMLAQPYEMFSVLKSLGLLEKKNARINDETNISPYDFLASYLSRYQSSNSPGEITDVSCVLVSVDGISNGKPVRRNAYALAFSRKEWKAVGGHVLTGTSAAIGAEMIANGKITMHGMIPPEACIEPEYFLKRIEDFGIKLKINRGE